MMRTTCIIVMITFSLGGLSVQAAEVLTPKQAAGKEGETVTIRFTVKGTGYNQAGFAELYSEETWDHPACFFVRLPESVQKKLKDQKLSADSHFGKESIQVTGKVSILRFDKITRPAIVIDNLEQIKIIPGEAKYTAANAYTKKTIAEFTVLVHPDLAKNTKEAEAAFAELESQLRKIKEVVPKDKWAALVKVRIWMEWEAKKNGAAEFHPSAKWLKDNGYNPEKAGDVEISNACNFVNWSQQNQPWMVMHELAHSYHHLVLGADHRGLENAYKQAMERKLYDSVKYSTGEKKKAYACTNVFEYFAEITEAYYGKNDFFPFHRDELKKHDSVGYELLKEVWEKPIGEVKK